MTTPSAPVEGNDAAPDATIKTLHALIDEMNGFVAGWVQRLNREILSFQCSHSPDPTLQKRFHEFENEKRQWEAMRRREALLGRERSDHLTAAWLQLEAEQRRLMQIKQTHHGGSLEVISPSVSTGHNPITSIEGGDDQSQSQRTEMGNRSSVHRPIEASRPAASGGRSREAAVRQFRRLREEIRSLGPDSG